MKFKLDVKESEGNSLVVWYDQPHNIQFIIFDNNKKNNKKKNNNDNKSNS